MPYDNYPQAASDNAQRALNFREENGTDCGTPVGWARANQLAGRESISDEDRSENLLIFEQSQGL